MDLEVTETARKHTGILLVGAIQADAQRGCLTGKTGRRCDVVTGNVTLLPITMRTDGERSS